MRSGWSGWGLVSGRTGGGFGTPTPAPAPCDCSLAWTPGCRSPGGWAPGSRKHAPEARPTCEPASRSVRAPTGQWARSVPVEMYPLGMGRRNGRSRVRQADTCDSCGSGARWSPHEPACGRRPPTAAAGPQASREAFGLAARVLRPGQFCETSANWSPCRARILCRAASRS